MAMIPDKSVDLIVIDPPYNIGKDKRWDKWETVSKYVNWMAEVFRECERVLKDGGSFYFWHNDFSQIVELQNRLNSETTFEFKQMLVWDKFNGGKPGDFGRTDTYANQRNYPKHAEYCLFYTFQNDDFKQRIGTGLKAINTELYKEIRDYMRKPVVEKGYSYSEIDRFLISKGLLGENSAMSQQYFGNNNQLKIPVAEKWRVLQELMGYEKTWEEMKQWEKELKAKLKEQIEKIDKQKWTEYEKKRYVFNNHKLPSVWQHGSVKPNGHITPKPVKLIENIITTSSNEGDVVLDCFMGSGTTAVAATKLNRNFIGFERESEYVRIANQRLEAVWDEVAERRLTEE
jgi:DNA modification methylase